MLGRARLLALGILAATPAVTAGCSSADEPPPENPVYAKLDQDFRKGMAEIVVVASRCAESPDPECPGLALADYRAGSSGIRVQSDLPTTVVRILYASRKQICRKVYNALRAHSGMYFSVGTGFEAGSVVAGAAGLERVWDLKHYQSAAFAYAGGGVSNLAGFSVKGYSGFAWALTPKGNIIDAVGGLQLSVGVSIAIPETDIGVGASRTSSVDGTIQGIQVEASIGLNLFNPGVQGAVYVSGYFPFDDLTKLIGDPIATRTLEGGPNGKYVQFRDGTVRIPGYGNVSYSRGAATAGNIVMTFPFAPGALQAAYIAYASYLMEEAGVAVDKWCGAQSVATAAPTPAAIDECGPNTASLGTLACSNNDDNELPSVIPQDVPPPPPPPSAPRNCFYEANGCESIFPGQDLVCSRNGTKEYCCRKAFEGKFCDNDSNCAPNEVCARATNDPAVFKKKACLDPKNPPTPCEKE